MRHIIATLILSIASAVLGIYVLGFYLGDSADHFWWHALTFCVPVLLLYPFIRKWYIPVRTKEIGIVLSATAAIFLVIYTIYLGKQELDGMAGMLPALIGLITSCPLAIIAFILIIPTKDEDPPSEE